MTDGTPRNGTTVLLLARSAFAAAPYREMQRLADMVSALPGVAAASYAFCEQGRPSLRDQLVALGAGGGREVVIVPLLIPVEPGFRVWLRRTLARWQVSGLSLPQVRLAGEAADTSQLAPLAAAMIGAATPLADPSAAAARPEGSLVPPQKRRVLVCHGGPCNNAGAAAIWVHLRNQQERLGLRTAGAGTMTAKSTCLGPCNLAPVLQVFPEGTYYGGIDEGALDRVIDEHLLNDGIVESHAYAPTGAKQTLRR